LERGSRNLKPGLVKGPCITPSTRTVVLC